MHHASAQHPVRIGLVGDVHYADAPDRHAKSFRMSAVKLAQAVEFLRLARADALVELGDFKDQDDPPAPARTAAYAQSIEAVLGRFPGPLYHALGNHDLDSLSAAEFQDCIANTGLPPDRTFYSFELRGLHGVVLDANFLADGGRCVRGDVNWTEPHIPPPQLEWLRRDLAAAPGPAAVFLHHRLDPAPDERFTVRNAAEVRAVLEQSGRVRAVFQGHDHAGGLSRIDGIPYYTLEPMFGSAEPADTAYALAEFFPDGRVTVAGHGRARTAVLAEAPPPKK